MKETNFLMARPARHNRSQPFLIGETGFSFGNLDRPVSIMDVWMNGEGLPVTAQRVLTENAQFADIVGLIVMPTGGRQRHRPSAGWVLARVASGLVSISIRDARDCDAARLAEDAAFATEEAQRFAAKSVVILAHGGTVEDAEVGRKAVEKTFGTQVPELNRLYFSTQANSAVWLAALSDQN